MTVAGIDGCKKGWIMIKSSKGDYSFDVYKNIFELVDDNKDIDRILIDIPIGLSSRKIKRTVEKDLRKILKFKHSTVFNPPCREALFQKDYIAAKKKNIEVECKSLSIQSYNISNKIRELEELLQSKPETKIIESHPELCLKYLNMGKTVLSKKSTLVGINERIKILVRYEKETEKLFKMIESSTHRKDVKRDDIVDALCLCLVNKLGGKNNLSFIEDFNEIDENGIEMKIAYYNKNIG